MNQNPQQPDQRPDRSETVYLHLAPGSSPRELSVLKMAKSPHAARSAGTVVVKAKISVPANFFDAAIPTVDIRIDAPAPQEVPHAEASPVKPWPATSTPLPTPLHQGHRPVQHRDGKEPWCNECGRNADGYLPASRLQLDVAADDE